MCVSRHLLANGPVHALGLEQYVVVLVDQQIAFAGEEVAINEDALRSTEGLQLVLTQTILVQLSFVLEDGATHVGNEYGVSVAVPDVLAPHS